MMVKNKILVAFVILFLGALVVTACSSASQPANDEHAEADEHSNEESHADEEHAHVDPPQNYEDLANPFGADNHEAIEAGEAIYETNCATCHGPEGEGDGPAAEGLDPKPASLADAHMMEELSDGYLFWRVTEGGAIDPFNSGMPAWKDVLSEDERWQVIYFVRTLSEDQH